MSHYANIKVSYQARNEASLVAALKTMFGASNVEVHEEPQMLLMYTGRQSNNKANIIVRKEHLAKWGTNDMGFLRQEDGTYKTFIDEAGFNKEKQNKLNQEYSTSVAMKNLVSKGYKVTRVDNKDGTVDLKAVVYA